MLWRQRWLCNKVLEEVVDKQVCQLTGREKRRMTEKRRRRREEGGRRKRRIEMEDEDKKEEGRLTHCSTPNMVRHQ